MASHYNKKLVLLLLLLAAPVIEFGSARKKKLKKTNLTFYMEDYQTGSNVTAVPVAGVNGTKTGILNFSAVYVIDNRLTEGPENSSLEIGRGRGMYTNSALDGTDLQLVISVVFSNGKFNGSTLQIQGSDRVLLQRREVSVVGGTGYFRFGRGYAVLETAFLYASTLNIVVDVTVLHY
ncbi:hypothetical protein SUGI_0995720 [Cryptomeria japonica]|uniref:dirigent protein 1 n=1 Tax=Cryptomeria japonica TaxID=3369 RepID=UPI002414AE0B|nr:dirigent protein 1 [Cryptomeria japonica]GLJ47163.1 hypothetical protein SUGI_0995720 [Cryptomeria japonica]